MGSDSADLLGGALEEAEDEQTGLRREVQGIGNDISRQGASAVSAAGAGGADMTASGVPPVEGVSHLAEVDALAGLLLVSGQHAAAALLKQQLLAGLQQVQGSCTWQQQVWLRHLAAFEWLWGDMLLLEEGQHAGQGSREGGLSGPQQQRQQQGQRLRDLLEATAAALGVPLHGASAGGADFDIGPGEAYQRFCAGLLPQLPPLPAEAYAGKEAGTAEDPQHQRQQHMPSSLELLQSWQVLCEQQAAAADALQAWRSACAAAVTAVGDVLLAGPGQGLQVADPTVCRKVGRGMPSARVAACHLLHTLTSCTRSLAWGVYVFMHPWQGTSCIPASNLQAVHAVICSPVLLVKHGVSMRPVLWCRCCLVLWLVLDTGCQVLVGCAAAWGSRLRQHYSWSTAGEAGCGRQVRSPAMKALTCTQLCSVCFVVWIEDQCHVCSLAESEEWVLWSAVLLAGVAYTPCPQIDACCFAQRHCTH
jgi:hypothetical protein